MHKNLLVRAIGMLIGYILCFWAVRLLFITLTTYVYMRSQESIQKVEIVVHANIILAYGISAFLFIVILHMMFPITKTRFSDVFSLNALRTYYVPNALPGLTLALVLVFGSLIGKHFHWLGIYLKFDEIFFSIVSVLSFSAGAFVLITVEEYIFRQVLEKRFRGFLSTIPFLLFSTALYLIIRGLQFDLTWLEAVNLGIFNYILSNLAKQENHHLASASFAATYWVILHTLFGLPFLGHDTPGLLLLRPISHPSVSLLSGGDRGPENGLVLTVLLIISLYMPRFRSKKLEV